MTRALSSYQREDFIHRARETKLDVLVIGGGITGAGILLDAQSRGMQSGLIDMQDFAAGTSNRSTKLVHGGLRYLKRLEIGLVAEVGRERTIVHQNARHVTTPVRMLLPIVKGGTYGRFATALALLVYDSLAGVKRRERHRMLSADQTIHMEPLLRTEGLRGAGYYVEYRTDDARLTLENIKEAVRRGAFALNYCRALSFLYEDGKVAGVVAQDVITGKKHEFRAKMVVNATGPWVDALREKDGSKRGKTLRHTKGVHIVVDERRLPIHHSVYFDVPDGRMVFSIPRDGKTYIGTTDTDYQSDLIHPRMTDVDRDYLLGAVNHMFPTLSLTPLDVESSWVGIRPLIYEEGKSPSEVSRKDELFQSDSGLITIAGGKLTGYRKMAKKVTDLLSRKLTAISNERYRPCQTRTIRLSGGDFANDEEFERFLAEASAHGIALGLTRHESARLVQRYGTNVEQVFALFLTSLDVATEYGLPPSVMAELKYSLQQEMAMSPADFFIRRTGALYFDIEAVRAWKSGVLVAMQHELGWDDGLTEYYRVELEDRFRDAVEAVPAFAESGCPYPLEL